MDPGPSIAQSRHAGDVRADVVTLDHVPRIRLGIESKSDPVSVASRTAPGNDVARAGRRPANRIVASAPKDYADAVTQLHRARSVCADEIALNQIAAAIGKVDATAAAAGNNVARSSRCAADGVVAGAQEINTCAIANSRSAGGVGADVVALNQIAGDGVLLQINARAGVAGNDVARRGSCATDDVRTCAGQATYYFHADNTTRHGGGPRRVRPDVVALNCGPGRASSVNKNAVGRVIAGNDVACGRRQAADGVVG